MSKVEVKETAIKLATEILGLSQSEKATKEQKDQLKETLTELCDKNFGEFFNEDGHWKLEEAGILIKTALNPPKMCFEKSNEPLKPADRTEIAQNLDQQYIILDIDFKKIQNRIEVDKQLKKLLQTAGVVIKQDVRYDVKTLK